MATKVRWPVTAAKAALVLSIIGGGLWVALHGVAGVQWREVSAVLRSVDPARLGVLALVWLGGLAIYSLVLSAALPGLGVRRSLLLNLTGSAVANVVPLGGAVATALNWRMVKSWGHTNKAFIAFAILTNALDVLMKLLLPLVVLMTLIALSVHVPAVLWWACATSGVVLILALIARLVLLWHRSEPTPESGWRHVLATHLKGSGDEIQQLMANRWRRLLPASIGYAAAQVLLLDLALRAVGMEAPITVVLVAAVIERLGTVFPLTPGGAGVAEVGAIAWLVAAGLDPVKAVAGVLLYRLFVVVAEIPVGALLLGGWALLRRGHQPEVGAAA